MIMPRGSDQLLLPVNPFFIAFTLLLGLAHGITRIGAGPALRADQPATGTRYLLAIHQGPVAAVDHQIRKPPAAVGQQRPATAVGLGHTR